MVLVLVLVLALVLVLVLVLALALVLVLVQVLVLFLVLVSCAMCPMPCAVVHMWLSDALAPVSRTCYTAPPLPPFASLCSPIVATVDALDRHRLPIFIERASLIPMVIHCHPSATTCVSEAPQFPCPSLLPRTSSCQNKSTKLLLCHHPPLTTDTTQALSCHHPPLATGAAHALFSSPRNITVS
jgi:hypothetical protein